MGTNDLRKGVTVETTADSIATMSKVAADANSRVILCSVLPVSGVYVEKYPSGSLQGLNAALRTIAAEQKATFVDAYDSMSDQAGHMQRGLTKDGLHLNRDGYTRLSALVHRPLMQAYYG
jgi:lysophospholipase L1-like esterase